MGRPSPQVKKAKRAKQKAKRKLVFNSSSENTRTTHINDSDILQDTIEKNVPVQSCEEEDIIGEDMDTLEMNIEDSIPKLSWDSQDHTPEYVEKD